MSTRFRNFFAAPSIALALCCTPAMSATLIHSWDFEAGAELIDTVGGLTLNTAPGEGSVTVDDNGTPGDTGDDTIVMGMASDISYEPGFMGVGQAYRPYYVDSTQSSTAGAGLTGSGFTSPNQFTIAALVKADVKDTGSAVNYIFQTRPGSDRGYYLVQDSDTGGRTPVGQLGSIIGSSFGDQENAATHEDDGHWFYIAAAIDLTSTPGQALADIYVADLTAGETSASLVADDRTWSTADPSALAGSTGIFGIGNFAIDRDGDTIAEASQEWFQGAIDCVQIWDGLATQQELNDALSAKLVPEPTALVLAALGASLLATRRR